jgi:short-subunit dehydrogenase
MKETFLVDLVARDQARLEELYNMLPNKKIKAIVAEIVELEISIEQDCNQ